MRKRTELAAVIATSVVLTLAVPLSALARKKHTTVNPDDPTYQLYQLLNKSYGGNLKDFYVLADLYNGPQGEQLQHVLRVNYNEHSYFGRLQIAVRSVGKLSPAQLKTYDLQQLFKFGEQTEEQFDKSNPGPFGGTGDLFLQATDSGPLASASITGATRSQYEMFVQQYILPALKKKK